MEEEFESLEYFLGYSFGYIKGIINNPDLSDKQKLQEISDYIDYYSSQIENSEEDAT